MKGSKSFCLGKNFATLILFLFIIILLIFFSLLIGPADVTVSSIFESLTHLGESQTHDLILYDLRLPRILLAFLVGGALSISGIVFQSLLVNPLADSFTTGVSAGAALGASVAIILGLSANSISLFALLFALITLGLVFRLSITSGGLDPRNVILSGIIISSILSAGLSIVKTLSGDSLSSLIFWLLGSFSGRSWGEVYLVLPYYIICLIIIWKRHRELDILTFGAEQADSLGVNVKKERLILLVVASLLTAVSVSVSGIIGFIGLVVPHILRIVFGAKHKHLILYSVLFGGITLVLADDLVRSFAEFGEIPLGAVTSLIGGPFFCYLLMRKD